MTDPTPDPDSLLGPAGTVVILLIGWTVLGLLVGIVAAAIAGASGVAWALVGALALIALAWYIVTDEASRGKRADR